MVLRSFQARVNIRVSYGCVDLRPFRIQSFFIPRICSVFLSYGRVQGFLAFGGLFCQGICQGQLRLCRVEVFQGIEFFCAWGLLVFVTIGQGLGFFSVLRSFPVRVYIRVSYGFVGLRLFRVQSSFMPRICLVFLIVWQGLGFFSLWRSFLVRVYIRVSYGCVGLRLFRVQSSFAPGVCQVCLRFGRVQGFSAF